MSPRRPAVVSQQPEANEAPPQSRRGWGRAAILAAAAAIFLVTLPRCSLTSLDALEDGTSCGPGKKACVRRCVDIDDPAFGCSPTSCDQCSLPNAQATCRDGACAIGICAAPYESCDGVVTNGCETNLDTNVDRCGSCQIKCPATSDPTATMACVVGVCGLICPAGKANCNGSLADGCEASLTAVQSCGACGVVCGPTQTCDPTTLACRLSRSRPHVATASARGNRCILSPNAFCPHRPPPGRLVGAGR